MNLSTSVHPSPIYSVEVDGSDITKTLAGRLSSLTLTDNRGFEADQIDIVLDDSDGQLALPPRGASIRLKLGWKESGLIDKGTYTVDELEHTGAPDILTIRARSADLRSGLTTQRERSFHGKTVGEIVREIASENEADGEQLEALISASLDAQVIEHIDQLKESSINFLTRLADMFDAVATIKNGKLLFIHAGGGVTASGIPLPIITITRKDGDQHRFLIADRGGYTHVKATWHDDGTANKGEVIWGKEEEAVELGRAIQAAPAPVASGSFEELTAIRKSRASAQTAARKEWARIKKSAALRKQFVGVRVRYNDKNLKVSGSITYGDAEDQNAHANAIKLAQRDAGAIKQVAFDHSADNIKTLRHEYASKEAAKRAARTQWRRLQRGMAEFNITLAHGNPELFPDMPATLQGFKREIDSTDWIITKATHSLSDAGMTTKLDFEIKATEIQG